MGEERFAIHLPFADRASTENAMQCFCMLVLLGNTSQETLRRFEFLSPVAMRMEVKQGIENSMLIDDSYNANLHSVKTAIDVLSTEKNQKILKELDKMYWYDKKVYQLLEGNESVAKLSRKTNIPYHSLYNTYRKVLDRLKKLL